MKKMFTLMAAVVIVASASAQRNNGNQNNYDRDRDVAINNGPYNHDNDRRDDRRDFRYNLRERDMKIARINNEYDRKIDAVRHKWFMNRYKREQWIYALEDQRKDEIKRVYMRYRISDRRNDRDFGRDDRDGNEWHH